MAAIAKPVINPRREWRERSILVILSEIDAGRLAVRNYFAPDRR